MADVVGSDDTRQLAGGQTQCGRRTSLSESPFPFDTIIAVANRVHRHILYHELGIFPVRLEDHLRPNRNGPNGDKGRNDNKTGICGTGQRNTSQKICTTT